MLSKEELELRKWTVGSSDVPSVCGLSPWSTGGDVLERKLDPTKIQDSASFLLGHKLERPIAELAIEGGKIPAVALVGGWTVVKDGWMSATPDFYALRQGSETSRKRRPISEEEAILVEVKAVGWRMLGRWDWGKKVPDYVTAQVQWQMHVLGHRNARVVALLGGESVEVFEIARDDVWIAHLKKQCRAFWESHLAPGKRDKVWARVALERLRGRRKTA